MLFVFTFLIKSFSPSVDVSIGDYKQEEDLTNYEEIKKNVDERLALIQEEDQGKNFSELIKKAEDIENTTPNLSKLSNSNLLINNKEESQVVPKEIDPVYKVYIGSYTSAEQAKVVKDIILETGSNLNPIVKCIGSNNYTLQVGIFKNKASAETLLYTIKQSNLPGRIVQEY